MSVARSFFVLAALLGGCSTTEPLEPLNPLGPSVPLRTEGRYIVDADGQRFKLASVNWYGASDIHYVVGGLDTAPLGDIVASIRALGFNSVRLPFSNEMLHAEVVDPAHVAANPELVGLSPLEVYDAVVEALTDAGIVVLLNNHTTHAQWCCFLDTDGLWFTNDYTEEQWIDDWVMLVRRYAREPYVVAADLRNEVRVSTNGGTPRWNEDPNDWRAAAMRAGNRILAENPDMLVVVEGINFPRVHLQGVADAPVVLDVPGRLVYAAHNYGFIGPTLSTTYGEMDWPTFEAQMDLEWGYVVEEGHPYTAPVWVSEFGESGELDSSPWFDNLIRYLREGDFDFAYWALNPGPKPSGEDEAYGLLEPDWVTPLDDFRTQALMEIAAPTTGPGVDP